MTRTYAAAAGSEKKSNNKSSVAAGAGAGIDAIGNAVGAGAEAIEPPATGFESAKEFLMAAAR